MDIFVRGVGVGLTHTEKFLIKQLRIARETGDLARETGPSETGHREGS